MAKRGKNKQKRNDLRQCSLAIVTTKEVNLPIFSHVYEGNTNDQTEFPKYLTQLKKRIPNYNPQEITLVFDGGSNTKKNLELLETHYICSFSLSCCKELYDIDISEYQTVSVNEKEVLAYQLTKSIWGEEEKEKKIMRCYFEKILIITDRKDWSTDLIIQSYREQDGIKKIFHDTKDTEHFSMRPIYHWTNQKIKVHVFLCLLGLTLTILLQKKLMDREINISKDTLMDELLGIRVSWVKEKRNDTIGGQVIRKLEEMNECQKKIWQVITMI